MVLACPAKPLLPNTWLGLVAGVPNDREGRQHNIAAVTAILYFVDICLLLIELTAVHPAPQQVNRIGVVIV